MPPRKSLPTAAPPAEKAASIAPSTTKASSPLDAAAQPDRAASVPEGPDTAAEKGNSHPHGSKRESMGVNIEDLTLPKSITTRLAKEHLPHGTAIQATAMLGIQKSATVFINYLANQANEYAVQANRKTVNPQDVLKAIEEVGFGEWREQLEGQLMAFENNAKAKRDKNKGKDGEDGKGEGEGRPRKKLKGHKGEVQEEEEEEEEETQDQDTIVVEEDEQEGEEEEGDKIEVEEDEEEEGEEEQDGGEDEEDEELRVRGKSEDEALDNGEDSD